jgi:hypothetical protein
VACFSLFDNNDEKLIYISTAKQELKIYLVNIYFLHWRWDFLGQTMYGEILKLKIEIFVSKIFKNIFTKNSKI